MRFKIYFRADGHAKMGLGHVIRSLALAEMLKEEFDCHFIIRNPLPTLREQILAVCKSIIVLPETQDDLEEANQIVEKHLTSSDITVLDGYHFVTDYQQIIKNKGCKLICIDDIHAYHFVADVVINHAGGLTQNDYSAESYTQFCLGLQYALLRKSFRMAAKSKDYGSEKDNNNLLICLGGADPNNDTLKVLKKYRNIKKIGKCYVVLGGAYQHREELDAYVNNAILPIHLLSDLGANEMIKYMQKCGQAITSPSTISYEYLSIGGTLYLKVIADNQISIYDFFINKNLAFDYQDFGKLTALQKNESLKKQADFFDGHQRKRFLTLFKSLHLKIRNALIEDMGMYFEWINDPETRKQSYSTDRISIENHQEWFQKKINDSNTTMYIILENNKSIGQIRFDCSDTAIIGFSLDKKYRGRGLGTCILRKGISQYRSTYGNDLEIIGFVKKTNIASSKAFRLLGFEERETVEYKDSYKYVLS